MQYLNKLREKPHWVLVLTVVLTLPALFSGWLGDDYIHYALLHPDIDIPKARDWSLFGLFSWVDATPHRTQVLMDLGVIPWWTYEGFRYQFWRPLAELSHWLDHALWRDVALLMHVHSLVWYLGLGAGLYRLYCRTGMQPLAAIAGLALFMWDSSHGLTLSWIANRNAIMAALFGVLCLLAYLDWRQSGGGKALVLSLFWLLCSLFSGEIGISTCGYLGAYALMVDKAGPRRALLALWPYVLVSVSWWVLYKVGHFGANHSDTNYIDPLESPLIFASKLGERIPVLLFAQFGLVPADVFGFNPDGMLVFSIVALLCLALVSLIVLPILMQSPMARFWALGCLFAAAPISASIPADRNLLMVGIGASGLLGLLFEAVLSNLVTSRFVRVGAYILFAIHLVISPLLMPIFSYSPWIWTRLMALHVTQRMPIESEQDRVLLFGLNMPIALATSPMRFAHQATLPERLWLMSSDAMQFTVQRVGQNRLQILSEKGMINEFEQSVRDLSRDPLTVGQVVTTDGMRLEIKQLDEDGHPLHLELTLDSQHMDDVVIIYWTPDGFERTALPGEGEALVLYESAAR
ncbi:MULTISPECIES: hypothetical protein [unclassified Ketobacter]|uniref:hypothetical protein n=1 Tax=unclassified Ketobacter TaxID=2639109 RepID=UPI000F15187C|nr:MULTISPECIES: hypothetical protein [unclassified Ketobacter]MCK5791520.1 hypothetical protein [Ketobacter sp.]RLT88781.1 MAG: hypothetical protein D9N13_16575 [Ketobacter sp. GenoA1]RLT97618.1 MAG: hypothetical protein D9N15_07365 [Ketobacter sp.]